MSLNGTFGDPPTNSPAVQPLIRARYPSAAERERRFAQFLKMPRNRNAWIVVNTNAFHICNDRDAFVNYESTKPFIVRTVGNADHEEDLGLNNTYTACGIGQLWLRYKTLDGRPEQRFLQDVLHIPNAFANVVSLPRLFKGSSSYKLDSKRGIAFSMVDDSDLAWFPPDFQGLFCLALKGETPYFPGPSSLHRRAPVRTLSVFSVGMPLPVVIDRFDKLALIIKLIDGLDPRDEESINFHGSQKTELTVAQILNLLTNTRQRTKRGTEVAALACPRERCFYRGGFVLKQHGDFTVCKDRDLFSNLQSIPPQPATQDSAEAIGIGDLSLDILFSDGSTGKIFIAGVLYSPRNLVNQIPYRALFDQKMVGEGGSFDQKTGIAADKDGVEIAWFTPCHEDDTFCLRQPDVSVEERKPTTPRVPPGLGAPGRPTSSKPTRLVNGKEINSVRERTPALSSGENKKVTFLTSNGSVGQIGAPRETGTAPCGTELHSTDLPLFSGAGTSKKMSCQVKVPGNDEDAKKLDQPASSSKRTLSQAFPAGEAKSKENSHPGADAAAKSQTHNPQPCRSQSAENSQTPPSDTELVDEANHALSALVAGLAKKQPDLGHDDLPADLRLPTLPSRTDPFFPLINRTIRDFHNLTHCFTAVAAAGKLTAMQKHSYFSALSKITTLSDGGPAALARMVMYDVDTSSKPPSLDTAPTPPTPPSPPSPQTPPPTLEEMQFHESPLALVERVRLHGRAAMKAIAKAGVNDEPRVWDLVTVVAGLAGRKVGSRITRYHERACKRKFGDMSATAPVRDALDHGKDGDDGAAAGVPARAMGQGMAAAADAVQEGNHEKEVLASRMKEKIEDVADRELGYNIEIDWDGTGAGDQQTTLHDAAKNEEVAAASGKTATERAAAEENPTTQDDTCREDSARDRPFAKQMLQAAKEPFIVGLLKLNEQNLALREKKYGVQKDAAKEEPTKFKKEQDAMAAFCEAYKQNLATRLEYMALKKENERLLDLGRNALANMEQEMEQEDSRQKRDAIAGVMKLSQQQDLTHEEQKALLGDEKVRVLLDLAAHCQQDALATLGRGADDGKKEIEQQEGNETEEEEEEEEQSVEAEDAAEGQTAKNTTPNDMKATEQVPIAATLEPRQQSPTAGEERAAARREDQCSLDSLHQKQCADD